MVKTNAIRILESIGVRHSVHEYDISDGKVDGISVALKICKDIEYVYKTLVLSGKITGINVFIIPVNCELDLKKAAKAANEKYVEMIKSRDLEPLTGYVHGGCSPIGMKKLFPTFIEETAVLYDTMTISAGKVGLQIEVTPFDLKTITNAIFADLI